MANTKKLMQAAAGAAGGAGLNVEEVFSTYLYTGTGSTQTITNNIDLSGEGGLVWIKSRTDAYNHYLHDTTTSEPWHFLQSNLTDARNTNTGNEDLTISAFNSDGFVVGSASGVNNGWGGNNSDFASWTFRKAPKFFDVVTYTGNGTSGREIAHNLGCEVGCIMVKATSSTADGYVYHRTQGNGGVGLLFSSTGSDAWYSGQTAAWNNTTPTSTHFTVGNASSTNGSGVSYVAYLFAHNDGDGDFGPDGDADIIKCGSYTGNGSTTGPEVDLGFEPQWILLKNASASGNNWILVDNMRGIGASGPSTDDDYDLNPNLSASESPNNIMTLRATGFDITSSASRYNGNGNTMIYIAIRRGPMAVPESATDVFNVLKETSATLNQSPPYLQQTGFPVDVVSNKSFGGASSWWTATRLTNARLQLESTAAETSVSTTHEFDHNDGVAVNGLSGSSNFSGYHWRRAPNFFDVVAWEGSGTSGYEYVDHNLGVTPEMIWFKNRDSSATPRGNWYVYHKDLANSNGYVYLNSTSAEATDYPGWATGSFPFSDTRFVVQKSRLSYSGESYIAYLFASVDGVSKVGSFTGNGSSTGDSQDIDCGFSSGARFVLVKAISAPGAWFLFDTERGIVAGNDSHLSLNSTAAEDTSRDLIDPLNSGFTINYHSDWGNQLNGNGQTYIFYAIA